MNYSKITDNLYIGTTPKAKDYDLLHNLGVKLVINMRIGLPPKPDPKSPSMRSLWLPAIDSPIFPIPIRLLHLGVKEALTVIEAGGVVYTHCSKGRHRGPVMGACILIAQGMSAEQAMQLIKLQRPISDPRAWYIQRRIVKFALTWKDRE
jgi:dual specificity MAP kinase phosphatase